MRVIVLGAGLVGISSAWYLSEAGHEVTVIDRQPEVAMETSFANGGQISVCHAEPWANPSAISKVLGWLGREDAPLLWRFRADFSQWLWGLRFLRECLPGRTRQNIISILSLALYSRSLLKELRPRLNLQYDQLERGILHFYTDRAEFEHAIPQAELMREFGCERYPKTAAECLQIEPALQHAKQPIVGGTYTKLDESGDAHKFTQELAARCAERGVSFRYDASIAAIESSGGAISGVRLANGELVQGDAYVVTLGSYSPLLLNPLGIKLPIYPGKGYSITLPLEDDDIAPSVSLTDDGYKLVFSRLGQRLRVAGTAEFNGYNTDINSVRCEALIQRTLSLFPLEKAVQHAEYWAGLRPVTPSNVPYVSGTKYPNLFLNTGHGTLGWTMVCGTGKLLADLLSQQPTEIDAAPYRVS